MWKCICPISAHRQCYINILRIQCSFTDATQNSFILQKTMYHYENLSLKFNLGTQLRGCNTQKVGTLSQQGNATYHNEWRRFYAQLQGCAGKGNRKLVYAEGEILLSQPTANTRSLVTVTINFFLFRLFTYFLISDVCKRWTPISHSCFPLPSVSHSWSWNSTSALLN